MLNLLTDRFVCYAAHPTVEAMRRVRFLSDTQRYYSFRVAGEAGERKPGLTVVPMGRVSWS
jgi:hypothetical protein